MLLDCSNSKFKEELLLKRYNELITAGVKPAEILVLVLNSNAKNKFIENFLNKTHSVAIEKLNVHSFFSIVYNTLVENWCFVENSINSDKTCILPNLVGLEVSQFILKDILNTYPIKGYNSKKSLLHQIFRRYSLIIQNDLTDAEIQKRSQILKESFGSDAEFVIKRLLARTLKSRSLDYLRQMLIFKYIYQNTDYFKCIKYIIADDADEMTHACFEFIKYLAPQLKDWCFCFDSMGSSRCGYLSADTSIETKLTKLFNEDITTAANEEKSFQEENGEIIFSNILKQNKIPLKHFTLTSLSKRAEIIDLAILKIKELLMKGIAPNKISVITPVQDEMLKFSLQENIKSCNLLFLSGSEKLINNSMVKSCLNILKLMYDIKVSEKDFRSILADFIGIPLKYCRQIIVEYKKDFQLPNIELEYYNEEYLDFYNSFQKIKNTNAKLSIKIYKIFQTLKFTSEDKINKFNFFLKQVRDFESVFGEDVVSNRAEDIIVQIENSIIAENPSNMPETPEDAIVIATPQKIIDNKISTEYQFWLDVSNSEWVKNDSGPLYNAWVFQSDWNKDEYTIEDDVFLSHQKTARILRKLLLLAENHVFAYLSLFDNTGTENFGGIEEFLVTENNIEKSETQTFRIIPRNDQKPVLEYQKGSMAISAVPGAGKTTILLALVMKLMNNGVNPQNIFILTYMDSAARNFKERIKNMTPDNALLPNISTIHGLALKIIKENANYERLNLQSDFEICDDTQRIRILKSIEGKYTKTEIEEYDRAISVLKLQEGNIDTVSSDKKVEKFKNFYKGYQSKLQELGLIDYDDILLLSVKLLENNPDILEYYQNACEYIIEDEAQDSSGIQQRLIGLLSGKHKNLVRCGDINQAITTTFSNADVEGFRKFIKSADTTVEMNFSQRCTQDVMDLANKTVQLGGKILPKAFHQSFMQGVEGKNPIQENAVCTQIFENTTDEKNFILNEIKSILTKNKDATIGILLRNNYQVANWTTFINNAGFKSITRSESLGQKGVFNTIFSILLFIQNPFDNEILANIYENLAENGFYKPRLQLEIRNCNKPFITSDGDELSSQDLSQFLWDMQYWLNSSTLPTEELVIRIGLFYYTSKIERSNVYLISTLVRKLNTNDNFDLLLERLDALSKKPSLSGFKFFSEEDDDSIVKGKVQIMTLHKSKGDEFEYVFIPELTEKALSTDINKVNIKASTSFMEDVRGLNHNYKVKTEQELKEFSADEAIRLFYVAITRAKKKLYITVSKKTKSFGKVVTQEPSVLFENIL